MAVIPRRGDALLFWDMHPNGTDVDRASLHASCPTIKVGVQGWGLLDRVRAWGQFPRRVGG
jgi:hypothetical protein